MEKLFTEADIESISEDARVNESLYLGGSYIDGGATARTIITITEYKKLIITEGNEDTGFKHFMDRHGFYSLENYWQRNYSGIRLDDPSKFHPKMVPIVDLIKIAEALFEEKNKNITINHRPDLFDKYTGTYNYTGEKEEKYHLLTYKDTPIVHTLFPDKKRYNPKRSLKLAKGVVSAKTTFPDGYNDLLVPYTNSAGITVYSILIRKFYSDSTERTFILVHDENGQPEANAYLIGERKMESYERFEFETIFTFQHSDLSDFEKIIREIDEQRKTRRI